MKKIKRSFYLFCILGRASGWSCRRHTQSRTETLHRLPVRRAVDRRQPVCAGLAVAEIRRQSHPGLDDRTDLLPASWASVFCCSSPLPVFGYDEDPTNAGYLYLDAYRRDSDAWELAASDEPLGSAFQEEFATDQYGGLLSLSAGVYRVFSPDAHRPLLILILTSFFSALGLPFLWKVIDSCWGEKAANMTAWFYTLYPESVILGASQMREPMLIGLSAIAAWGVVEWKNNHKRSPDRYSDQPAVYAFPVLQSRRRRLGRAGHLVLD